MKIQHQYKNLAITLAVIVSCSSAAFADGNAFTPLNFDDNYTAPVTTPISPKIEAKKINPVSKTFSKIMPAKTNSNISATSAAKTAETPIGNENIQNAILELDNAQVGIRNDLLKYKAKYSDVDAQYKLIKNERAQLNKQIRAVEKRIKNIDNEKDKIRKNML